MITSSGLNCFCDDDDQKYNDSNLMNKKIISKATIINFPQNKYLLTYDYFSCTLIHGTFISATLNDQNA